MTYTREQLESLLALEDFHDIYAQADALRRETVGDVVHIRALLEFSNHCKRLCTYCGLNATDQKLSRFRMDPRDMIATAQEAARAGYRTIVLQSGEDPWYTPDRIGDIVKQIKKTGMAITLSCGEFPEDVYQYWRDCGADRYLLKHETSDPALYASLHPDSSLDARVACLRTLKKLGYETGGGFMIGLPGQTLSTIAGDLLLLQDIGCDMAGIGRLSPIRTPPSAMHRTAVRNLPSALWHWRACCFQRPIFPLRPPSACWTARKRRTSSPAAPTSSCTK